MAGSMNASTGLEKEGVPADALRYDLRGPCRKDLRCVSCPDIGKEAKGEEQTAWSLLVPSPRKLWSCRESPVWLRCAACRSSLAKLVGRSCRAPRSVFVGAAVDKLSSSRSSQGSPGSTSMSHRTANNSTEWRYRCKGSRGSSPLAEAGEAGPGEGST